MVAVGGYGAAAALPRALTHAASAPALDTQEFSASGDSAEVRRILRDLAVPFFHHEFVKQASVLSVF